MLGTLGLTPKPPEVNDDQVLPGEIFDEHKVRKLYHINIASSVDI